MKVSYDIGISVKFTIPETSLRPPRVSRSVLIERNTSSPLCPRICTRHTLQEFTHHSFLRSLRGQEAPSPYTFARRPRSQEKRKGKKKRNGTGIVSLLWNTVARGGGPTGRERKNVAFSRNRRRPRERQQDKRLQIKREHDILENSRGRNEVNRRRAPVRGHGCSFSLLSRFERSTRVRQGKLE